jgi:hypothetical protein
MKNKSALKISMITVSVMIGGLLASGASAIAQSNDGISALSQSGLTHCSNRTLYGDYGSNSQGVLLVPPALTLQFVGVTMTHFDGRGDISWVEHTVVNGAPLARLHGEGYRYLQRQRRLHRIGHSQHPQ